MSHLHLETDVGLNVMLECSHPAHPVPVTVETWMKEELPVDLDEISRAGLVHAALWLHDYESDQETCEGSVQT